MNKTLNLIAYRGRIVAYCDCGWVNDNHDDPCEAAQAWSDHHCRLWKVEEQGHA